MTEAELQKKQRNRLKKEGAYCWRNHGGPHGVRGLPDVSGVYKGFFFAIESKLPGKENTLTPIQDKKLRDIRAAGGVAIVATTVPEALEVIRLCKRKANIYNEGVKSVRRKKAKNRSS